MAEPNEGYIRLHRRLWEHPYWQDPERLRAWIDCLLMAAWKPHRRLVGTTQVDIPRGAFVVSERFLAERWGWSRGKVRRFLAAAQEANEIRPINETSGGTTYVVVKYDDYQRGRPTDGTSDDTEPGPPSDQERTTIGPPSDQIEGRERREEERNNEGGGAQPPIDWKDELRTVRDRLADSHCTTSQERRRFMALADTVIEGAVDHWRNPHTGSAVPVEGRPELFREACLNHFGQPRYNVSQSLVYTLKSRLDPANDSEAKKRTDDAATRRLQEEKRRDAEIAADQKKIREWKTAHPDELSEIEEEVYGELGRGTAARFAAMGKINSLVMQRIEGVKRAG